MYVRLLTNNFLSEKAVGKSESKDVHLAVLRVLPEVIRESVDADASSKSVIVYDPASGEKKMVSPTAVDGIESLGEVKTAEQREAEINARMQDTIQRGKDWLEGNVANPVGMQIQLGDGRIATIEAMHEDGKSAIATLPDGTQFLVSKDVLQRIVNNGQYADYKARRDAEASNREAEQGTESAPETATEGGQPLPEEASTKEEESREYAQGDVFDVVVDGQKMHAEIVSPKDADGRFVVNVDDGESMRTLYVTPEELAAMEYRKEPSTKAEETRIATEGSSEKALERGEQPTEEHTPTALERIPRDEKGNAQFHDVDTETAWDGLVEMSGNEETAHKVAEASLANAERKLKAAKALKEKGETPEELLRSIKENEAAVAKAQRTVDAWKAIVGEKARREEDAKAEAERIATEKAEAERKAAEERERAEAEEEARVEAERKAEEERIAKQKAEEKAEEAESDKEEAEKRMDDEEPKPVGSGVFGNIYNQFKGKVKEAFDFLMKHKGGDLLGVFHRKDVGDIDLVWGDENGGLAHILNKHVGEGKSFANVDEAMSHIQNIIETGKNDFEDGDKIVFRKGSELVTVRKNFREGGKKIADKNWVLTAYDKEAADNGNRVTTKVIEGKATPHTASIDKGSEKPEKKQEKQSVFDKAKEIADKEEKKRKAEADKPKQKPLTEAERKDAEEVAGALGYRVEWVDTMEGTIDADKKVIRIAKDAENPLVQVLGHEVAHGVKRMDGGKFKALQKAAMEVVGEKEWNERIEKKRKLNAYADGKLAEEVTCDIVGEALNDKDALKRLAESLRGEKGILARLRDAVAKMVEYFKNRGDKEGVRRMKAADKLLAEFESALKENVASGQANPEGVDRSVRENRSEKTELTAEERELRDNLVERMRKGGLDVVTDSEEMQRVIDTENERTRNKRSKKSEAARKRDEALYAVDWSTAFVSGKSREEAAEIRRERGRKFKEETKELYGRVLSGNFDDVTLRLIDKFVDKSTPNNPYERPISKRLPARALQKMRGGERTGSVDALFSRISESAVGKDGKALPRAERERAIEEKKKELLKKWAVATGNWHTDVSDFSDGKEPIGSGTDSDVYLSKDGKSVIKVSKGKPYGKRFRPDVDNVALFNTVFPGSRYTIEGYGEIDGKFVRFLEQPIVDFTNSTPLTEGERVAYMEKLGFKPINKENTAFSNGEIIASDLQKSNIVKDEQGNVRVIDADMKLHTKDFGGKFSYPDAETDTRTDGMQRFLRTADGEVYGLVKDGRIYLDPKVATAETAVHEYTHLWGDMLRRKDSEQWNHTVKELKNSVLWEEVKESYPELKTDDEIADEVLSTFSGRRGAERLREEARRVADGEGGVFTKAKAIETLEKVKETIARFWEGVARMFGINRYRSAEELADMAMRDLINGVKPTSRTFTFDNFYKDTKAVFEGTERPKGKPDYTSYSGSEYWYGEDKGGKYVVRGSDHWSGEFKVKDGERTNVGRNHYSEITEDGMLPIGAQGSLKFGWEKGLSKPVGSGISAAIDRRGSGDSNNIASCYWYIDNAKEKDNKGFTYGKAYLSEFEDKERRRDIPGDDWRDIQGLEGGTRNMFVGERGATEADKAEEVSTRLDNLSVARRMEEAKKDAKTIKMATGWERGSDGKWRYETGDAKIKDTIELDDKTFKRYDEDMLWTSGKFGDVVDAPELFKAYPELRDVRIETDAVLNDMPSNGEYNPRTNTITIHSDDLKYQNSILNHEIQHAIQHIEGFETGGSAENVRERIQQVIDNSSDEVGYARERLREWADLNAMAAMLDVAYRKFVGSGNEWERAKAVEIYWDAINTIEDNDKAELAINYPHDKTPREVAESGYLVDDVIRELNRLADETRKEIPDGNIDTMRKVDRLVGALKDKTDFELYNRLAGEVEARNTEKRIGMTEEERRASLASETEDVAREDQILLRQGLDGIDIMRSEAAATPLKGDEVLTALDSIFGENEGSAIPPKISSFAKFKNLFKKPVRTFLGELVQVKDEVWNKILRNNRQDITGTVLPTIENADFAIRDTDGSTLYVKRFKGDGQERMYNVVVVNKHGEVEDYISSVHIKRDNNLRNKIKKGAELFLPNARTTDGTMSRNNSTPTANVTNISEPSKPRYSRKPGESIFDYASRVSEDVDRSVRERVSARDEYEKKVKSKGFQTKEALQNSMLGLQEFMSAIDHASGNRRQIEDIPDFENPILGENRLSSVNKEEMHQVAKTQFKPLMSAVAKLSGNGKESGELYDYMFAKHGLERDAVMRQREAQKEFDKYQKANPKGTKTIGDFVASLEGKDYAGLTALTAEDGWVKSIQSQIETIDEQMKATDDQSLLRKLGGQKKRLKVDLLNAARDAADDIRKAFENNPSHDRSDINELWSRVNEVNGNTLRKLYESGMLTKEAYDDISSMYTNYIPMRGFDQTTSADAYAYLTHGDSAFNAPIKTAKGRSSKADNPIAYMQAMAESAIMQGNRNVLVKQKMLNFVRNHPSDLASVSDVWLQYDSVADEWKPFYAFGRESKG